VAENEGERSGDEPHGRGRSTNGHEYGPGDDNGDHGGGNGHRKTFSGTGFGTLMLRMATGPKETPPVASTRAYLRNGLPSLYQDGDFGMRFVGALEELLDPIVAVLDGLPAHFDPNHAPRDVLELLAAWLGVDLDESQELRHQREMVRRSAELGRRRGTVKGLELALALHFPGVPVRVEDHGGVHWAGHPAPEEKAPQNFVVYCDKPVDEAVQAGMARCIEQYKPVHATYRLRVKAAKKKVES
jgi:phage tail-like protein